MAPLTVGISGGNGVQARNVEMTIYEVGTPATRGIRVNLVQKSIPCEIERRYRKEVESIYQGK